MAGIISHSAEDGPNDGQHKSTHRCVNFLDPGQRNGNLLRQKDIITGMIN